MNQVVYERQKLYKEVWAEPVTIVASRYVISDVALRKHCKKLNIPLPERGYWSRIKAGYKAYKKPLPKSKGPEKLYVNRNSTQKDMQSKKHTGRLSFLPDERRKEIEDFCNSLTVPDELHRPHPLVVEQHTNIGSNSRIKSL